MITRRLLLAAALSLAACVTPQGASTGQTSRQGSAPDFTLRDVDGRDVSLSDFAGRVVLLDFWATWCVPCEAAMPHLQELYRKYEAQGFTVLAISMDGPESLASVGPFVRRYDLSFPVLLDVETQVTGMYNPKRTAPLSVFIGRDGTVAHTRQGFSAGDEQLVEAKLLELLGS